MRDLGAMQVLNGNVDDARSSFAQALAIDSSLDLDPAYKNPQIEHVWNEVKKKGGGAPAPAASESPSGAGATVQPAGDFVHTPPAEALVRTPMPIYVEYSGGEQFSRVVAKYKGPGMGEWKALELPRVGTGWGAFVPCKDVASGTVQYYVQGFNAANDPVATSGSRNKPFSVSVKPQISGPPPSLPGQEAPKQCEETAGAECPPDFPGCNNKKSTGDDCTKDGQCKSSSCLSGKCSEKRASGEACYSDDECSSDSCLDGKCSSLKKEEGEDCTADDECDSSSCKEGKCGPSSSKGKFSRWWVGVGGSLDFYLVPDVLNVVRVDPADAGTAPLTAGNPYSCVDPNTSANFPGRDGVLNSQITASRPGGGGGDQVLGGFARGNLRVMLSVDYALNANFLLGMRVGYEFFTDPATTTPKSPSCRSTSKRA